jgi:DHA1 family multidrug resistance protein-like MFS transporter
MRWTIANGVDGGARTLGPARSRSHRRTSTDAAYTRGVLDPAVPDALARQPPRRAELSRGLDASLGLVAGLSLAAQMIVGSMLPIVPVYAQELGATPTILALMVSISAVATAAGQLLGGFGSGRMGARRLLPVGLMAYGAATLVTATATVVAPVVALRGLTGLGSGLYLVGERLYIRQIVKGARLAFANGVVQASAAVGLVAGPLLGGVLADATNLRTPFVVIGVGSLIVAVAALALPKPSRSDSVDAARTGTRNPVDRSALTVLLVANLCLAAGYGSFITTFAPFASDELRWTTLETGLAFSLFGLGNVVGAPLLGGVADRRGRRFVGSLSALPIVALAVVLVLPTPSALVYLLALVAGAGVAGFTASWYALLGTATAGPAGGRAFGIVAGVSSLGTIVGALLAGRLWESFDIRIGMLVTVAAMALAGLVLSTYPRGASDGAAAPT